MLGRAMTLAAGMTATGCGWILGLDEFTDQPPPSADAGVPVECTSPEDCPAGEHGSAACEAGTCTFTCEVGFADCDDAVGCETSTSEDKSNCGGCGVTCSAYCQQSICNDPVLVAAMDNHTCALLKDGSVWCWGRNSDGQVGDGTTTLKAMPTKISLPGAATHVAGGGRLHTCALLADQTVACWGANSKGQLGIGSTTGSTVPVPALISGVRRVSAGRESTCAVKADDTLLCWGSIISGGATSPVQVASSVADVSVGVDHACLITTTGALECWGSNLYGELGIGSGGDQTEPHSVSGVPDAIQVACGAWDTCARNAVGMYCWGASWAGQLGLGDTTPHDVPQALDLPSVQFLALGYEHSSASAGGELYTWGRNQFGQLGDATAVDKHAPVNISLAGVKMMSLGTGHSCALTDAGVLLCWGHNAYGQLGDGTTVSKSVPTPVVWP